MPSNRPWAFALYTIAAFCYRWIILASIIIFLTRWLEPYGLDSVGRGIAIFAGGGMLFWPGYKLFRYMSVPGRMHQIEKPRFAMITVIGLLFAAAMLCIPFPHSLRCSLIMVPQSMETVYVQEPGLVDQILVENGEVVDAGDKLAVLKNVDMALALEQATGQLNAKQLEKSVLNAGSASSDSVDVRDQIVSVHS